MTFNLQDAAYYVDKQDNNANMQLIYVHMQDNYVNIKDIYVSTKDHYINMLYKIDMQENCVNMRVCTCTIV